MQDKIKKEIARKAFHMTSLWMAVAAYVLPTWASVLLFVTLSAGGIAIEHGRRHNPQVNALVQKLFGNMLRDHEKAGAKTWSGAVYMLIGAAIACVFGQPAAVTALVMLMVADTAASLVGMTWGRHKVMGKSIEGSIAFVGAGLICVLALSPLFAAYNGYLMAGVVAAVITAGVELVSKRFGVDDNISIPLACAGTMKLMLAILG